MPGSVSADAIVLLRRIPYFRDMTPEVLEAVARSARLHIYAAGQLVILEGEPAAGLYAIQEGRLKVSKIAVDGREQILQLLKAGEAFNAVSVFSGSLNPASVTALEAARVWCIGREQMLGLLDTQPQLARRVIEDLAGRIQYLIGLVEDLSLRTVEARLARLLLEQAQGDAIQRRRWATQSEIAARLGSVPDVVSRTLRRLAKQGIISVSRQEIRLLDRAALEAIARVEPPAEWAAFPRKIPT